MPYGGYKGITIKFGADTTQLGKALKDLDNQSKEAKKTVTELNKALKVDPTNVNLMSEKYKNLATQIDVTKKRIETLKSAESGLKSALAKGTEGAEDNWKAYQQELSRTETRLKTLENQSKQTTNALKSQLTGALSDIKSQLASVVKVLATAETAFVGLSAKAVKTGMDFDTSMSQVAATMGKTTDEITNLRDFAQEMGETTAFSASEAAQALNYMALAGYDSEKAMKALPDVLNLAAAGGLDLATASDMVTDAQSALGLSMEDTTKMVDQMATAASKSNTSVGQLGEAILTIGGTAKSLKGGTTELATDLGILADAGIKGAEGGTKLRNAILSLSAPTDKAAKELANLGVETKDADGNFRSTNEIFKDLQKSLEGLGSADANAILSNIFNKRDLAAINALLANCGQRYDELSGYIAKANGSAKDMANTQLDNLKGDLTILKSEAEALQIAISDKLNPALREIVQEGSSELTDIIYEIKNGDLSGTFEQFGKDLSDLVKNGIHTAAQMLPSIIKFLSGIIAHIKTIITLLIAYKGLNILSTTVRSVTTIINSLKGLSSVLGGLKGTISEVGAGISNLSTAQKGFGAVGLAATIGTLIKSFIDYKAEQIDVTASTSQLTAEQKRLCNSCDELVEKSQVTRKELNDTVSEIKNQGKVYSDTANEIYELSKKESLSKDEKSKLKAKIEELNQAIPDLNLSWDENTNQLSLNQKEMKNLIDTYINSQEAAAAAQKISEIKLNLAASEEDFNASKKQYEDLKSQVKSYENELANLTAERDKMFNQYHNQRDIDNYNKKISETETKLKNSKEAMGESAAAFLKLKHSREADQKSISTYEKILGKATKSTKENASETEKAAQKQEEANQKYEETKSALTELSGVIEKLNQGQSLSAQQVFDLIQKYPELTKSVIETKDGYMLEAEAIKKLTQARADDLKAAYAQKKQDNLQTYIEQQNAYVKKLELAWGKTRTKKNQSGDKDLFEKWTQALDNKEKNIATVEARVKKEIANYNSIMNNIAAGTKTGSTSTSTTTSSAKTSTTKSSTATKKSQKSDEDNYKNHVEKLLELNEYKYNMGKKSEAQYYAYIKKIRDKYYNNTKAHQKKYASEIRDLNLQLHNYAKETAEKTAETRKKNAETTKTKIESLENKYINGSIKSKNAYVTQLKKLQSTYIDSKTKKVKKGYEDSNKLLKQAIKNASAIQKKADAEAEKRATEKAKTTGSNKENYYDWTYNMSEKTLADKKALLKHYQDIDNIYYKNKSSLISEHRQMLLKIKNLQDEIANDELTTYKSNVEDKKDSLKTQYESGKLDAFAYYKKLQELNDKYYKHRTDCAEEYATLQKEINEGIRQAQEDNINNIIDLSEKTNDVIQATEKLRGAEKQKKIYYDSARGFYHGTDITAVTEARTDLYNAQKDLMQQAISLNGNLTASELSRILSNLPSFNGISLPSSSTTNNTNNQTVSNSFVFNGDIKTDNPEEFLRQINNYIKQTNIDLMIGK